MLNSKALSKEVGHYVKKIMPGKSDNPLLVVHRDSVFAQFGAVKIGAFINIRV